MIKSTNDSWWLLDYYRQELVLKESVKGRVKKSMLIKLAILSFLFDSHKVDWQ